MKKKTKDYVLVSDDDGHWYVIPAGRENEFDVAIMGNSPQTPEWAEAVGGAPTRVKFQNYTIT